MELRTELKTGGPSIRASVAISAHGNLQEYKADVAPVEPNHRWLSANQHLITRSYTTLENQFIMRVMCNGSPMPPIASGSVPIITINQH